MKSNYPAPCLLLFLTADLSGQEIKVTWMDSMDGVFPFVSAYEAERQRLQGKDSVQGSWDKPLITVSHVL